MELVVGQVNEPLEHPQRATILARIRWARLRPVAHLLSLRHAETVGRARLLLRVVGWELRRLRGSRVTLGIMLGMFVTFLGLLWLGRNGVGFGSTNGGGASSGGYIVETTLLGLASMIASFGGLVLGMVLPFVTTDGVARDLKRRTHELLMTTPLPCWAYVWGRYLASLLASLASALVLLLAIVATTIALHATQPGLYPAVDLPAAIAIWAAITLPAIVLLGSFSFALGMLLPRRTNVIKAALVLAWLVCGVMLPSATAQSDTRSWYTAWDPTSVTGMRYLTAHFLEGHLSLGVNQHALLEQANQAMRQLPDVGSWVWPHLVLAVLGVGAVALAAQAFSRFRNVLA